MGIIEQIQANSDIFYTVIGGGILTLIIFIINWFGRKRITYASFCGRIEHWAGRILGVLLLITIAIEFFNLSFTIYFLLADFFCWLIYLTAHTFEKLLYGNRGFR